MTFDFFIDAGIWFYFFISCLPLILMVYLLRLGKRNFIHFVRKINFYDNYY